jgi:hypothetical protein
MKVIRSEVDSNDWLQAGLADEGATDENGRGINATGFNNPELVHRVASKRGLRSK